MRFKFSILHLMFLTALASLIPFWYHATDSISKSDITALNELRNYTDCSYALGEIPFGFGFTFVRQISLSESTWDIRELVCSERMHRLTYISLYSCKVRASVLNRMSSRNRLQCVLVGCEIELDEPIGDWYENDKRFHCRANVFRVRGLASPTKTP